MPTQNKSVPQAKLPSKKPPPPAPHASMPNRPTPVLKEPPGLEGLAVPIKAPPPKAPLIGPSKAPKAKASEPMFPSPQTVPKTFSPQVSASKAGITNSKTKATSMVEKMKLGSVKKEHDIIIAEVTEEELKAEQIDSLEEIHKRIKVVEIELEELEKRRKRLDLPAVVNVSAMTSPRLGDNTAFEN